MYIRSTRTGCSRRSQIPQDTVTICPTMQHKHIERGGGHNLMAADHVPTRLCIGNSKTSE